MSDIISYFQVYGEEIYRYLRKLLREEEAAKDILQETFLRAMKTNIEEKTAKNYLFRIAHNLAIDYLEERNRFLDLDTEDKDEYDPEEIIEKKDIWKLLSPLEKSILILYYQEGYSYEEISEKLNIPLNTLKSHIYRAKKKIYNYLKEEK
ncbi:MAG: RNA polymerase sigma factor [Dictyoglomus turgidum]|nr:MAG: RNA polymerase sigma factor [Dictyoglomus turgidum]